MVEVEEHLAKTHQQLAKLKRKRAPLNSMVSGEDMVQVRVCCHLFLVPGLPVLVLNCGLPTQARKSKQKEAAIAAEEKQARGDAKRQRRLDKSQADAACRLSKKCRLCSTAFRGGKSWLLCTDCNWKVCLKCQRTNGSTSLLATHKQDSCPAVAEARPRDGPA